MFPWQIVPCMTWPLKKAYKTAFDFIMPTHTVTKNKPALNLAGIRELRHEPSISPFARYTGHLGMLCAL